jgi:phosphoenolpyruvate carboxykinase (GTP)
MATAPQHVPALSSMNRDVSAWVNEVAKLTTPQKIYWCDGSEAEYAALQRELVNAKELQPLNQDSFPGCVLSRSHPSDVARVEHLTFVCTQNRDDAGPNNHWIEPKQAHAKMDALFAGCMKGRTLYVVPYCMGPIDSPFSRCGIEITDSAYVVLNMHIMTRMGRAALERITEDGIFVRGLHSTGDLNPERRFIMHFPEELSIKSFGSGYGGNALLGKKCHALRIASWQARTEGWLAEHMLIVGIENPQGETHYLACAFPSACGKTNLAMLIPPASYQGWKVWTVGDDIAWLHPGKDGRLYAINPESGYFGVVPGTNAKTNRNAYEMIRKNTIFTNVGLTADNQPWWEGLSEGKPVIDWQGRPYDPANGPAAQPNSRFTVAATQNPSYSKLADAPGGVPISAIIFGGRRRALAPLVYQARNWLHGVLVGAGVASETTAAATDAIGVVRRDPMAMKPFAGYNFGDYWAHWINVGARLKAPPQIFHVNWFRQDNAGKYLWPGFGDNLRVLRWIIDRCKGSAKARDTAIGALPNTADLDLQGLDLAPAALDELLTVNLKLWQEEFAGIDKYLSEFGGRVPASLKTELKAAMDRVHSSQV